jgi:hypothetical protein
MKMNNCSRFGLFVILAIVASVWTMTSVAADSKVKPEKKSVVVKSEVKETKDSLPKGVDSLRVPAPATHQVIAYYFHGNVRCPSCRKIEAYTKEAIDSAFGESLKSGKLEWRVVNTDSSENEHYLKDYQLFTKSVVLSDVHDGTQTRWKNLGKVWELLGDQAKFHAYIQDEMRPFLDSTK